MNLRLDSLGGDRAAPVAAPPPAGAPPVEVILAAAADQARAGRYRQAEILLTAASGNLLVSAPALDLLARIRAQQGRPREARELWEAAARLDPSNATYAAAIAETARLERLPAWRTWPWPAVGVFAAAVLVGVVAVWQPLSGDGGHPPTGQQRTEQIDTLRTRLDDLLATAPESQRAQLEAVRDGLDRLREE